MSYIITLRYIQLCTEFGSGVIMIFIFYSLVLFRENISTSTIALAFSIMIGIKGVLNYLIKSILEADNYMSSTQRLLDYSELSPEGIFKTDAAF